MRTPPISASQPDQVVGSGGGQLYDQQLARLPGVQRLTSTLVMKNVVADRPLPA